MDFVTVTEIVQSATDGGRLVSATYLRRLLRNGVIAGAKYGKMWLVEELEAQRWLSKWLKDVDKRITE